MSRPGAGRRPLVSGNWKMNLDHLEAIHAVRDLGLRLQPADVASVDVAVHPPFTDIRSVQSVLEGEGIPVALGAQDCAVEDRGAFTGEVSPVMLARLHVEYVIVGHSERRTHFGETDAVVAAKVRAVLRNGMVPVFCVGETVDERDIGLTQERLTAQVSAALGGVPAVEVASLVVAYEPVWAIGTGQAATPGDAQEACALDPGGGGAGGGRGSGHPGPDPVRRLGLRRQHGVPDGLPRRGRPAGRRCQPGCRRVRGDRPGCVTDRPVSLVASAMALTPRRAFPC